MSWQLTSFAGLVVVLIVGIAWYERTRPSARTVALVAALAALAVASRVALAPVPNVVGTTDVALITGYALGGPAGFAVGALAAPVSNLWLGQGPWTIWQMGAWGLAGIAGAGLAMVFGRSLGRFGLAVACALMAFAYGAILDLSLMVTYGGEQSLDRFLAISARGLPFNAIHAAGNFTIAFAAGPALVAIIGRYRDRLAFRWHPVGALPALVVFAALSAWSIQPEPAAGSATGKSRVWLEGAREHSGGYAATPGSRPSVQMTGWAMLGLESAGRNPLDVGAAGRTPVDYLRARADKIREPNELELTILALEGAGIDARKFDGRDLVARLERVQLADGSWAGQVSLTAYGVLALRAAGSSRGVGAAAQWLRNAQRADGGWGYGPGRPADPDSTGAALQGLAAAGAGGLGGGVDYLRESQRSEGGWGLAGNGPTNTQSTAWAVQGLVAAGIDPGRVRNGGRSPLNYLRSQRRPEGYYAYNGSSAHTPVWVTSQALLAVGREALPIEPVARGKRAQPQPDLEQGAGRSPTAAPGGGSDSDRGPRSRNRRRGDKGLPSGKQKNRNVREPAAAAARVLDGDAPAEVEAAEPGSEDEGASKAPLLAGIASLLLIGAGGVWYYRRM